MTILIKCQLWQLSLQQDANKVPSGWPTRMETAFYEFDRPLKARKGQFMARTRSELHSLWSSNCPRMRTKVGQFKTA